jgi:RNA polymerase sigma-70 factor (ECF subfamily)
MSAPAAKLVSILTAAHPALASDGLAAQLETLLAAARRAWPAVALDDEVFVTHLAERLSTDGDVHQSFAELHATDLYLACACARGLPQALAHFEREHLTRVGKWIARIDRSRDFADEVTQQVRERLLVGPRPRITDYNGSGPLGGWARVVATRVALNARRDAKRLAFMRDSQGPVADPQLDFLHGRYRGDMEAALKKALSQLDTDERELLRLHYVDGLSLQQIGEQHGVDKSTISRRLAALRRGLLDQARSELERLVPALTTASRDSLLWALQSQIDLSLTTVLGLR